MGLFPEAQAAQLAGADPRATWLVRFDFASAPSLILIGGYGALIAGGDTWQGAGDLIGIDGLEQVVNGEAPEITVTLTGLDSALMTMVREDFDSEARDRALTVYLQFLEADDDVALDAPYPIVTAHMKRPAFTLGEDGTRIIPVSAESRYALRSRPPISYYTDAEQQRLYAGDKGFQFVAGLRNKVVTWPDY